MKRIYSDSNKYLPAAAISLVLVLTAIWCGSCAMYLPLTQDIVEFARPAGDPNDRLIVRNYNSVILKEDTAAETMEKMVLPEHERTTEDRTALVSQGEKKKGKKAWFKLAGFDQQSRVVMRKYLVISDERPKFLANDPWECFRFECELILSPEAASEVYPDANVRNMAMLGYVLDKFDDDLIALKDENKQVRVFSLMVRQAVKTVLVKLEQSPSEAAEMADPEGLLFEHTSLDKGRIRLQTADDRVIVRIWMGSHVKKKISWPGEKFEDQMGRAPWIEKL